MKLKLSLLTLLAGSTAQAAIVAQYDMENFTESSGSSSVTANSFDSNVTVSTLDDDDATSSHAGDIGDILDINIGGNTSSWNTFSGRAMDGGEYLEFTVTPLSGFSVSLSTLTLDSYSVMTLAGGTTQANYLIKWSGDGYTSTLDTIVGVTAEIGSSPISATGLSADLSAISGQTAAFTIRLEVVNGGGANGVFSQRGTGIDNLTLNGDVTSVPEPSSTALMGLGVLALTLRRRK